MNTIPSIPSSDEVLSNPATSYWLRDAIQTSLKRDPVDALNDAETLVMLLESRLQKLQRRS